MPPLPKVFLSFFPEDKTSAPDVFSSCSFIPRANFETSSVAFSDIQLLWLRDMTLYVAGGKASFGCKYMFFSTFFNNKSKSLKAKIMQSAYLCVIYHVKLQKYYFSRF